MLRKIIAIVTGCLAILLVLFFFITLLLTSFRGFFGEAITWVLCACIAALMLFVVYVMVNWLIDTVKKKNTDEEKLSERHIERILNNESARQRRAAEATQTKQKKQRAAELKREQKRAAEEAKAIRKQEEFEAKKAAEEAARLKKLEEEKARQVAEAEARAQNIAKAEEEARRRAELEAASEEEKRLALAEAEALRRAAEEAQRQLQSEEEERRRALKVEKDRQEKEAEETAARKAQAITSARKQAEAVAAARRRAAQTAARTQAFSPLYTGGVPAFNTQMIEKIHDATGGTLQPLPPPAKTPAAGPEETGSIWEKMQVRQSAKPILGRAAAPADRPPPAARQGAEPPQKTGHAAAPLPEQTATGSWTYTPAKLPDAWKADATGKRIPGDMTYASTQGLPAQPQAAPLPPWPPAPAGQRPPVGGQPPVQKPVFAPPARQAAPAVPPAQATQKPPVLPGGGYVTGQTPRFSTGQLPVQQAAQTEINSPLMKRPRGRPPKPKTPEELNAPKRPRGRPPKPKTPEELNAPKRPRGRPPKPKTPEELNAPKRPRGRPRKEPPANL